MPDLESVDLALLTLVASPSTKALLKRLHTESLNEPAYHSTDAQPQTAALDRFVALDPDKCALIYLLLRASGATSIVEAGTSFGVSTIWLALAAAQNAKHAGTLAKVIATENESTKAARARNHWQEAGEEVASSIELREGDILETLKTGLPDQIDFLLLDIWSSLALPTLELVQPHLKIGSVVAVDNNIASQAGYRDLFRYFQQPEHGFTGTTVPFEGGLCILVYVGPQDAVP